MANAIAFPLEVSVQLDRYFQLATDDKLKADFEVVADRRYILRSGTDTVFTKGLIAFVFATFLPN